MPDQPPRGPRPGGRSGPHPGGSRPPRFGPQRAPAGSSSRPPRRDGPAPRGRAPDRRAERGLPPDLAILYEDRGLLVIEKPPGLAVHSATSKSARSVERIVSRHLGPRGHVGLVHELDRDASGVLVLTTTPRTHQLFERALRGKKGTRVWVAVVHGEMPAEAGTLQSHLHLSSRGVTEPIPDGSPTDGSERAVMHYRVLGSGNGLSVIRVRAETDIPGQVRAQLAESGHAIVGDRAFNAERDDFGRLALHLAEVACDDPRVKDPVPVERKFKSAVPSLFWTALGLTAPAGARPPAGVSRGWNHVADWYDELIERRRSDHHDEVVHPGVVRMLGEVAGARVLDVACGNGELCRELTEGGAEVVGVDASPDLIEAARARSPEGSRFEVADARSLDAMDLGDFDAVACVLALMNIDDLERTFAGIAARLKPGGRFVMVVIHPAFRVPRHSAWQWEERDGPVVQHRVVDRYLRPFDAPIVMNPGAVASGEPEVTTTTHHRPISAYINACAHAGLLVDAMEEWASARVSEPGPRAEAENTARAEIPMFLAIRAVKAPAAG